MNSTIINNSQDNIQVYTTLISDPNSRPLPELQNLTPNQVPVVGSGSNSDLTILGDGTYIYCGIWNSNSTSGEADSWVITDSDKVLDSVYNNYLLSVSGSKEKGFFITVTDSTGYIPPTSPTTSTSSIGIGTIFLISMMVLAVIVMLIGAYLIVRKPKPQFDINPFIQ